MGTLNTLKFVCKMVAGSTGRFIHTRIRVYGNNLNIVSMCAVSPVVHTSNISSCQKKKVFKFPVAVKNSIKVGPLVFLL